MSGRYILIVIQYVMLKDSTLCYSVCYFT